MLVQLISPAYAQVNIGDLFGPAKAGFKSVGTLVNVLLPNIFTVAGVIAFILVVASGINMIAHAGSGDAQELEKDQKAFTAAIVGLVLIFASYFIVQIVSTVIGYNILNPPVTQ